MTAALIVLAGLYLAVGAFHVVHLKRVFPASNAAHPKGAAQVLVGLIIWPIIHVARFRNTPERVEKRKQAAEYRRVDAFTAAMSKHGREEAELHGTPVPQYLLDAEEKWAQKRAAR